MRAAKRDRDSDEASTDLEPRELYMQSCRQNWKVLNCLMKACDGDMHRYASLDLDALKPVHKDHRIIRNQLFDMGIPPNHIYNIRVCSVPFAQFFAMAWCLIDMDMKSCPWCETHVPFRSYKDPISHLALCHFQIRKVVTIKDKIHINKMMNIPSGLYTDASRFRYQPIPWADEIETWKLANEISSAFARPTPWKSTKQRVIPCGELANPLDLSIPQLAVLAEIPLTRTHMFRDGRYLIHLVDNEELDVIRSDICKSPSRKCPWCETTGLDTDQTINVHLLHKDHLKSQVVHAWKGVIFVQFFESILRVGSSTYVPASEHV